MRRLSAAIRMLSLAIAIVLPATVALAGEDHVVFISREDRLILDADAVQWADLSLQEPGGPAVELSLQPRAAAWVSKITRNRVGEEMQVVYRDRVVISPVIHSPIESGQVMITGLTMDEAKAVVEALPSDWAR